MKTIRFFFCAPLVALAVVVLSSKLWRITNPQNLRVPSDQALTVTFHDHRAAFYKLQQMASEDQRRGWFFSFPDFRSATQNEARLQDYRNLMSRMPNCFSATTDSDGHLRFCFAQSEGVLAVGAGWVKGIEFWPERCPWSKVSDLDDAQSLPAGIYVRQMEPQWFLFYQRDD